jgi:hypothetical protein
MNNDFYDFWYKFTHDSRVMWFIVIYSILAFSYLIAKHHLHIIPMWM